jgi:hypothetical protein
MKTNNCKTTVGCASTHKWLCDEANKWGYPMWGRKKNKKTVVTNQNTERNKSMTKFHIFLFKTIVDTATNGKDVWLVKVMARQRRGISYHHYANTEQCSVRLNIRISHS